MSKPEPVYKPSAYIDHLPKSEKRDFAKSVVLKWSRVHKKDPRRGLVDGYNEVTEKGNEIISILHDIEENWDKKLLEHRKKVNEESLRITTEWAENNKLFHRASLVGSIEMLGLSKDHRLYEMVRSSEDLAQLQNKIMSENYVLDKKAIQWNEKFYETPFSKRVNKLIEKVDRCALDRTIIENFVEQYKAWKEIRPNDLLNYITDATREVYSYVPQIFEALVSFTDKKENRSLPYDSTVGRCLKSFVNNQADLNLSLSGVHDRIENAFSQADDALQYIDVPEPETNTAWFFDHRPTILQVHTRLSTALKTGYLKVKEW